MCVQMISKIQGVEETIGYEFDKKSILWEALQAAGSGVTNIDGRPLTDGNKRLALLGDAIVDVALIEQWYAGLEPKGEPTC